MTKTCPSPYPEDGAQRYLDDIVFPELGKTRWMWTINEKHSPNTMIGCVELTRSSTSGNRGFWLGTTYWGQGFMTEATAAVNDFAFDVAGFSELIFMNARGNIGSHRVKEKHGAKLLRIEPSRSFHDPNHTEEEVWLLTKEAWHKRQN